MPILAPNLSSATKKSKQVFVAYPYKIYDQRDYRKVYNELSKAFGVQFLFADEKITDFHILQKIYNYISESTFSIFDISGWNPNVTLELGLALGMSERCFIVFDPSRTDTKEVPSDIPGVDRVQYNSFSELGDGLTKLLAQEFPPHREHEMEGQIESLRKEALKVLHEGDGLKIGDIATALAISVDLAKLVVRPLIGTELEMKGVKKGARYYRVGA